MLCSSCHSRLHWLERRKYPNYIYKSRTSYGKYMGKLQTKRNKLKREAQIKKIMGVDFYYRIKDLCKIHNLTKERIRQLTKEGRLNYKKIGGCYFYYSPIILRFTLDKQKIL